MFCKQSDSFCQQIYGLNKTTSSSTLTSLAARNKKAVFLLNFLCSLINWNEFVSVAFQAHERRSSRKFLGSTPHCQMAIVHFLDIISNIVSTNIEQKEYNSRKMKINGLV
ncbi:hypothetical protein BpHYR1_026078 [Brachionus plicatilis]|uniref:Uncharacterized protein n=1 Tax=Brachionus plicatilis TaxID=10195 RepID=A0A3M7S5S3_BRAPC|nr:hypothetical protein BpHYR1_026078 [Brachionus plicatilis]